MEHFIMLGAALFFLVIAIFAIRRCCRPIMQPGDAGVDRGEWIMPVGGVVIGTAVALAGYLFFDPFG